MTQWDKEPSTELCEEKHVHEAHVRHAVETLPREEQLYDLAELFKAFGDTTRIKILCALMEEELCVCDIATLIGVTQSAISHQLRMLKQARLVSCRRDGKSIFYALADDHVHTMLAQGVSHVLEQVGGQA